MAVTHWWVGGGSSTNWNATVPTNWSIIGSGGAGGAAVPVAGDDVIFDGNSGTGASVWNTSISLNSLVCTGSKNLVTHNSGITLTISGGNLALPSGAGGTYTAAATTSLFSITGTSGTQTITFNGKNMGALTLDGVGGTFQTQDAGNVSAVVGSIVTLTNGTFDTQTFTFQAGIFNSNNANTRVLKGSGAWTVGASNSTGNIFIVTATLTKTNFTSALTITGTTASSRTFTSGGFSYGALTIGANTSGGNLNISGGPTFASVTVAAPNYLAFQFATTTTITAAFSWTGSAGNEIGVVSQSLGSIATIAQGSGTSEMDWCGIRDMTFSGGTAFNAYNSFDLGHNTGVTILPPNITRPQAYGGVNG